MRLVSLHNHSDYSLLDGIAQIKPLVKKAKELGMPALAITDHGTMAGALGFYLECKKQKINPIIGVEMYVDDSKDKKGHYKHVILLAKNLKGYKNLLRIVSEANINGFYKRPRISTKKLFQYGEGLIVSTACMGGILARTKTKAQMVRVAEKWKDRFGDDFYIEVQFNEIAAQKIVNKKLFDVAEELDIKVIPTLDSHYVDKEDVLIQDFVLLVRSKKTIDQRKDVVYQARSLYLMDGKELYKQVKKFGYSITKGGLQRILENTVEIADKCNLKIPTGKIHIPSMGLDTDQFNNMVKKKFKKFWFKNNKEYKKRIVKELKVVSKFKFHDYFIIVQDLVNWCRKNDIFVGPARGSVAGSLIAYVLQITMIDPIEHGLIFERFLNEDRVDVPDIDLDFDSNKRDRVINYLSEKYGRNKVAKVVSFGTFGQVGALKDVGRVFKLASKPIDEIASVVYKTGELKDTFKELSGILKDFWKENKKYFNVAKKITGMIRNYGVHPCGVIIAPKPVYTYCPLQRVKGDIVSAYSEGIRGRELTEVGLIKYDILGLNTCSIIAGAIDKIKETEAIDLNNTIWRLDLTDKKLIKEAAKGNTIGGFQFESEAATRLLRTIKPETFYEIAALNAINRPGPLSSGAVEKFENYEGMGIKSKKINKILKETRGVLCYQEQVIQILHQIAGYTLSEADNIRKLAAKKMFTKGKEKKFKKEFFSKCSKTIGKGSAKKLWEIIKEFTQYSFNKSHSVSYAYLFFQILYLKNYYPRQFFVSLLSNTESNIIKDRKKGYEKNKLYKYIGEARRYRLNIYGPDINKSEIGFSIEKDGIRFGLSKIKGLKTSAIEIVEKRPYKSFRDFLSKVSSKIHKGKVIALIQAGCFDCFGDRDYIKRQYNSIRKDKIFTLKKSVVEDSIEAFGFILLHPFFKKKVRDYFLKHYCTTSQQLDTYSRWNNVSVAGIVINVDVKMQGKSAIVLKIQDHRGDMFVYLDDEAKKRYNSILKPFNIVMVHGRIMGGNRLLCYGSKDKMFNVTERITKLLGDKKCQRKTLM